MPFLKSSNTGVIGLVGAAVLATTQMGFAPEKATQITPRQFVRAVVAHEPQAIDLYLAQGSNLNARVGQDRPILLSTILAGGLDTAKRLIAAGACVDLADENGLTPLMAASLLGDLDLVQQLMPLASNPAATDRTGRNALHYAIGGGQVPVAEVLLPAMPQLRRVTKSGGTAITMALEHGNPYLIDLLLAHLPTAMGWNDDALQILDAAVAARNKEQVKTLLSKHSLPPIRGGKRVPLLAYAVASNDTAVYRMLLDCGVDPNTILPDKSDADFLALLPKGLRDYIAGDKGVSVLTLAAGLGQCEAVHALLQAGADRQKATLRYKMLPLYVAAHTGKWQCAQILLGGGPAPQQLRIEISLASQRAAVIKDGVSVFDTICSTGRDGYSTRTGDFVITDKSRIHRSTIYKVDMPYFMRLSCLDFGMHEGAVPNHPASHGCIRLPSEAARKLFAEIPIGTLVTVK